MKRMEIEKLLHWAYRDELSKRMTSSAEGIWDHIYEDGQRGGIDPGHGAAQRYAHFGLPHPDAEALERAVATLENLTIDWPASRSAIMGDAEGLLTARDVIMVRTLSPAALVTSHSSMGTRPDWREESPMPFQVAAERGTFAKIVGECRGHNRYTSGSYCPLRWEPSPITIAQLRADYVVWWRGLQTLAETVQLSEFVIEPPAAPEMPWRDPAKPARIIKIGGPSDMKALPLKPARGWYSAPERRSRSPVIHIAPTDAWVVGPINDSRS